MHFWCIVLSVYTPTQRTRMNHKPLSCPREDRSLLASLSLISSDCRNKKSCMQGRGNRCNKVASRIGRIDRWTRLEGAREVQVASRTLDAREIGGNWASRSIGNNEPSASILFWKWFANDGLWPLRHSISLINYRETGSFCSAICHV